MCAGLYGHPVLLYRVYSCIWEKKGFKRLSLNFFANSLNRTFTSSAQFSLWKSWLGVMNKTGKSFNSILKSMGFDRSSWFYFIISENYSLILEVYVVQFHRLLCPQISPTRTTFAASASMRMKTTLTKRTYSILK